MKRTFLTRHPSANTYFLAMLVLILASVPVARGAITLYSDSFESYPVQNPAPNPLTNGPAGGQWVFVDPVAPFTASEHRILDATAGSGFNSRVWASSTNNARLTNAISVSVLPAGAPPYTFRLTFAVAADTTTTGRTITFDYAISSTAGDLSLVSGQNRDNSQTFAGLSGTGLATSGTTGKSDNRIFEFVFQSSAITTADKINFDITRVTNSTGSLLNMFLDDVRLAVDDTNGPLVQTVQPILTLQHVRVVFSEPVDPASATNLANYSFPVGPLTLQAATLLAPSVVELFTSDQAPSSAHTLQISGVLGQSGISMVSTQLSYTAPALTISPLRYDAGTTVTQPSGPVDPTNSAAGYWTRNLPAIVGVSVSPVFDDNGTGLNAWKITDSSTVSGTPNYTMAVGQAASMNLAASNGWRIVTRNRLVTEYGSTATDQYLLYYNPGVRYGIAWGVDAGLNLYMGVQGGANYTLTSDAFSYHTNMMVYNPATKSVSVYFDGRLIVDNYTGQVLAGSGFTFGNANSAAKGEMNYNLVQLDVVGATQPVVTLNPNSSTNAVGQTVTFTAGFTPFVNAFQWFSNSVLIAGATATSYTTPIIGLGYSGSQYSARALSALGNVDTTAATLTVTDQTNPPVIFSAKGSLLHDRITLVFSQPVMETYATNIANYSWVNAGVTNISVRQLDPVTVELRAGPFLTASNYTVRVSNLRNLSNVSIAPNSPASVIFPTLSPLARYDAGNTNSSPSGPPDPITPAGGNWSVTTWSDPNLTVTAVTDDSGTGLNAWQVRDAATTVGAFAKYTQQIATNLQDNARQFGWVLTVRGRLTENFGIAGALFALYENYQLERFGLGFNLDGNNDIVVGTSTTAGFANQTVTADGSGQNYHLHQVVYNPATATAAYYFDGNLIVPAFPVSNPAGSVAELMFGAGSSAGMGSMNYNLVELSSADAPFVSIEISGNNAQVSYRGVLEAASQLGSPITWTAVATNLTSSPVVYSAPLNGQQFFRARLQ